MSWLLLVAAGLLEIVWAVGLKQTGGWTRLWPWVGIGALGVALVGILWLGESAAPARLVLLGLIVAGVVGLRLLEG